MALTLAASTLTAISSGFFHPLWSYLSSFWGESSGKAGPGMDPWGGSLRTPPPSVKAGPGVDPDGHTLTAPPPSTNAGAGWDPDGFH
jgi:hypothetical protein